MFPNNVHRLPPPLTLTPLSLKAFVYEREREEERVYASAKSANKHELNNISNRRSLLTLTTGALSLSFAQSINLITFVNVEIHEPNRHWILNTTKSMLMIQRITKHWTTRAKERKTHTQTHSQKKLSCNAKWNNIIRWKLLKRRIFYKIF